MLLGYEVMYTRDGDIETDDLGCRAQRANDKGADLFVSIHCNSAESVDANGVEVYHYPGSSEGMFLADNIQGLLALTTPLKKRDQRKESDRKEKFFFVPKAEIVAENYDLSMGKYKEDVFEEVVYEKPGVIIAKLKTMESEINQELAELEGMLG